MKKAITFYGTESAIQSWFKIIQSSNFTTLDNPHIENERNCFTAELTANHLDFLQREYWYEAENENGLAWNHRISFIIK